MGCPNMNNSEIKSIKRTESLTEYDIFKVVYHSGKEHEYIKPVNKLPKTVLNFMNTTRGQLCFENNIMTTFYTKE